MCVLFFIKIYTLKCLSSLRRVLLARSTVAGSMSSCDPRVRYYKEICTIKVESFSSANRNVLLVE